MSTRQIIINGTTYQQYSVIDTQNTRLTHYWINGRLVEQSEFNEAMKESMDQQGGTNLVLRALNAYRH